MHTCQSQTGTQAQSTPSTMAAPSQYLTKAAVGRVDLLMWRTLRRRHATHALSAAAPGRTLSCTLLACSTLKRCGCELGAESAALILQIASSNEMVRIKHSMPC